MACHGASGGRTCAIAPVRGARTRSDSEEPALGSRIETRCDRGRMNVCEDGPAGICDEQMRLCFAVAIRSGGDGTLRERLVPVPRDVLQALHPGRQPADAFPICGLITDIANRSDPRRTERRPASMSWSSTPNRAPRKSSSRSRSRTPSSETATLQVLPQLWFRQDLDALADPRVVIERAVGRADVPCLVARHPELGAYYLHCELAGAFLFTGCAQPVELNRGGTRARGVTIC